METKRKTHGTLFDLYPEKEGMVLWIVGDDGERLRLWAPFTPSFFVWGAKERLRRFLERVKHSSVAEVRGLVEKTDFWSGKPIPVMECAIRDLTDFQNVLRSFGKDFPDLDFYNCDLLPTQHFTYATDLFPLCTGWFYYSEDLILERFESEDSSWSNDYEIKSFRTMNLDGSGILSARGPRLDSLTVKMDGEEYRFDDEPIETVLEELNRFIDRFDPDVILSRGGDSFLFPFLLSAAKHLKIPLKMDRDPVERKVVSNGRSFFSYGRVLYQAPDYPLFGRWHLDVENSFLLGDTGLEGLFEIARVSRIPVQRIARRSIGTAITSIQIFLAYREGFLIPWKKSRPEAWKTAWTLLHTDRGGLVYQPIIGFHENVYELDFASMYPTIMAEFNVSPETVNCPCCNNRKVPEINYTICERREGLVSRTLRPILEKRKFYKRKRSTAEGEEYRKFNARQSALKWLLVCCFGYLGYRNARFGRIEAHETVCAFARDKLLRSMEIAEEKGFRVLHSIVDCIWVKKKGATLEDIRDLCGEINDAVGLTLAIEGRYKWIAFLPSVQDPQKPVPNRFFGVFETGEIKCRGIECRKSDQPRIIRRTQEFLIGKLKDVENLEQYKLKLPEILSILKRVAFAIRKREVPLQDLLTTRRISMEPNEYRKNTLIALAARQAAEGGLSIHPGEKVVYLICNEKSPIPEERVCIEQFIDSNTTYDVEKYLDLLAKAGATVLFPLGITSEELRRRIDPEFKTKKPRVKKEKPKAGSKTVAAGDVQGGRLF